MTKRLFIGGIPYATTEAELRDLVSKQGTVTSVTVITDKFTGQGKGFAFVEMSTDDEADKVIKALNETDFNGRKIVVSVARPLEERPQRNFDRGGYRGGRDRGGRGGNNGNFRQKRW
jgi:RNA recognition motif-containing protein